MEILLTQNFYFTMPWNGRYRGYIKPLTPKQLKAKMDKVAKKESEKYRLMR